MVLAQSVVVKVMGHVQVRSVWEHPPFQIKLLPLQSPQGVSRVDWGGSNFNCNTACLSYSFIECDVSGLKHSSGVLVI
jgi:hypothetical protein